MRSLFAFTILSVLGGCDPILVDSDLNPAGYSDVPIADGADNGPPIAPDAHSDAAPDSDFRPETDAFPDGSTVELANTGEVQLMGVEGEPFQEHSVAMSLSAEHADTIAWQASSSAAWLRLSEPSGAVQPGATRVFTVALHTPVAEGLTAGQYHGEVSVSSHTHPTLDATLVFKLTVISPAAPAELILSPPDGFIAEGPVGGPITPAQKSYTVTNGGGEDLDFAAESTAPWAIVSGFTQGTLAPGQSRVLTVGLANDTLELGQHTSLVELRNHTNGVGDKDIAVQLTVTKPPPTGTGRVTDGIVALYDFDTAGSTIPDVSAVGAPLDLVIGDDAAVSFVPGGLSVNAVTSIASSGPATKVFDACSASNAVTIEAWIDPASVSQSGPARIISLSGDNGLSERNLMLGQGMWGDNPTDVLRVRARTTETSDDGTPALGTSAGAIGDGLLHAVYTRSADGTETIYVDGEVAATDTRSGHFVNWDPAAALRLASESGGDRSWRGILHLVALYERALSSTEVAQNFAAGAGIPDVGHLAVSPGSGWVATGPEGGPYAPSDKTFTLTNSGTASIDWSVAASESWIAVDTASGSLAPGESAQVTFTLSAVTDSLDAGSHTASLTFTNTTDGFGTVERPFSLSVGSPGELRSEVSRHGVTWTFDQPYPCGQFINGDWWVLDPGAGVTIQNVSPGPSAGRNGSMINPPMDGEHHFDDRTPYGYSPMTFSFPETLTGGASLVSAISRSNSGPYVNLVGATVTKEILQGAAVLTVVTTPPSPTAFRPPYASGDKPLFDYTNVRWDLLPQLAAPDANVAWADTLVGESNAQKVARLFERSWLFILTDWLDRMVHPMDNMPGYHREIFTAVGDALSVLLSDAPDKEALMIGFLQAAIDLNAHVQASHSNDRQASSSAHRGMLIFAGYMLDDAPMRNPPGAFRSVWMTYYADDGTSPLTSSWVPTGQTWFQHRFGYSNNVAWAQDQGSKEHVHLDPSEWNQHVPTGQSSQTAWTRETYLGINSRSWPSVVLAMKALGAESDYDHPAFFDWVELWMSPAGQAANTHLLQTHQWSTYNPYGSCGSKLQEAMWNAHRKAYP